MLTSNEDNSGLRFEFFGGFSSRRDGKPLVFVRPGRSKPLLARLVLATGTSIQIRALLDWQYPRAFEAEADLTDDEFDRLQERRKNAFDHIVMACNKALGNRPRIVRERDIAVQLDVAGSTCDILEFNKLIKSTVISEVEAAIALYTGPFLSGFEDLANDDEEVVMWIDSTRSDLANSYCTSISFLARKAIEIDDFDEALRYLLPARMMYPGNEQLLSLTIRALKGSGNGQAAEDALTSYLDALGIAGSERNAQIEQYAPRLVDTERLTRANLLPILINPLVQRQVEVDRTGSAFVDNRLVTLTGFAGIGKTSIALMLAQFGTVESRFPGGICFVDLAPIENAVLVNESIRREIGRFANSDFQNDEEMFEWIGLRRILIILDNCERVTVSIARFVRASLAKCAKLGILATSREHLGLAEEQVVEVPPMAMPSPVQLRELSNWDDDAILWLGHFDAIRFFIRSARLKELEFRLSGVTAQSIVDICEYLEGIPLAIELATPWLKGSSLEGLRALIRDRFGALTGGDETKPARYRTLLNAVQWSYDLLTGSQQEFLCRFSVFRSGCDPDALRQVCLADGPTDAQAIKAAKELIDRSLLWITKEGDKDTRYRMLESVREFAEAKLKESGEWYSIRRLHAIYYQRIAEEAKERFGGIGSEELLLAALDKESNNLQASVDEFMEEGDNPRALRMFNLLWWYWWQRGQFETPNTILERVIGESVQDDDSTEWAHALRQAGLQISETGDHQKGEELIRRAVEIFEKCNDQPGLAFALNNLGNTITRQRRYDEAIPLLERSVSIRRSVNDRIGLAYSLDYLGHIHRMAANVRDASRCWRESLGIFRAEDNARGICTVYHDWAPVLCSRRKLSLARRVVRRALRICKDHDDARLKLFTLDAAALVLHKFGADLTAIHIWSLAETFRVQHRLSLPGHLKAEYDTNLKRAKDAVGRAVFKTVWAEGQDMTIDRGVDAALEELTG